ncbi:hypothetical protein C943_00285 [Mariniradius saccharolyticus AK6]|uniref:Uncharacterized protein n=1 Tax=Mariniradius saccharolyticus AK6 TaxID=1239962 RepID=M7XEN0_9BACT|nr:hypothetical protein C943_00285 [Mariniradius saccharolyticus AK6]
MKFGEGARPTPRAIEDEIKPLFFFEFVIHLISNYIPL